MTGTDASAPDRARLDVTAFVAVLVTLGIAEFTVHYADGWTSRLAAPVAGVLVVVIARARGVSWRELGLARDTWGRGARWGGTLALLVAVVVAVIAAIPAFRDVFLDDRYDNGFWAAVLTALVYVPLRTVLPEELAFRGVLLALLLRPFGPRVAVIGSSVLFGLWHVTSALGLADQNQAVGDQVGTGTTGTVLGVVGAVLATTVAGMVLAWLRLRSGSLLAPIGLHWAVNGVGVLAAGLIWSITT